jgi:multidrug efflux pump subunit AcrA (membrane-fusion protein)
MFSGTNASDSFHEITKVTAEQVDVDRVNLLVRHRSRPQFFFAGSSIHKQVDRRSRQARLLARLAKQACAESTSVTFVLGERLDSSVLNTSDLAMYLDDAGCRELHLQPIVDSSNKEIVAFISLERFRSDQDALPIDRLLDPWIESLSKAVVSARQRDDGLWSALAWRVWDGLTRHRGWVPLATCGLVIAGLAIVPMRLTIPAEGRIVARQLHHIYAPDEGFVDELFVEHGDLVNAGQVVAKIRSPRIELVRQSIQGELATAITKLESLTASRTKPRDANMTAEEQVLRVQIAGLRKELEIIIAQSEALTLRSPIAGRVDAWNAAQVLNQRPVSFGQFLLDIVDPNGGRRVELEVPDQESGYVVSAFKSSVPPVCTFRIRSSPEQRYGAPVHAIASAAHESPDGQSMVRVTANWDAENSQLIPDGARVIADIDCGNRSALFVLFRGVIQWWRTQ